MPRDIKAALRPGGSYVAAMGCHTDSAVWPRWRKLIAETSSIPIYDHSLEDVSKAFSEAGFTVAVRPLDLDAFMQVTVGSAYFPKVVDQLRYYSQDKVLFRFVRHALSGLQAAAWARIEHGIALGVALAVEIGHDAVGIGMDAEQAHRLVAHGPEAVRNVGGQRHAVAGLQPRWARPPRPAARPRPRLR